MICLLIVAPPFHIFTVLSLISFPRKFNDIQSHCHLDGEKNKYSVRNHVCIRSQAEDALIESCVILLEKAVR